MNNSYVSTPAVASAQPVKHTQPQPLRTLKVALDVHLAQHTAAMQYNGSTPKRKQLIVALARGFAADWWRLQTQQTTPQKPGLLMNG